MSLHAQGIHDADHLRQTVDSVVRRDVVTLRENMTVGQALADIRGRSLGEVIVYFYVVDAEERLVGVLPIRRLLTADLERSLSDLMIRQVISVRCTDTLLHAYQIFVRHKFLAFPVVDEASRVVGVINIGLFTDEANQAAERDRVNEVFEAIGVRVSQVRDASPLRAVRLRMPWLLATIVSGVLCALLASVFEATLREAVVLAFFLTLVLGLGESVSIQTMTVTIQVLRGTQPTWRWYLHAFQRETGISILLGAACGSVVGLVVWLWRGDPVAAFAVGASILLALGAACFFGLTVPTVLHALKLDPKIAAGPVTLALTDIFTILVYLTLGTLLL